MSSTGMQVKRRLFFISILILLVVIPAAVMGYIAYSSLEEIKFKADFYYERVAYDISLRMMRTLEAPLYEPGLLMLREYLAGVDLSDPESTTSILNSVEESISYARGFVFVTGPVYGGSTSNVFATDVAIEVIKNPSYFDGTKQVASNIFEEVEMFGASPRGFYPINAGAELLAISGGVHEDRPYVMSLMLDRDRRPLGLLFYGLDEQEYLQVSKVLYETTNFQFYSAPGRQDIANELGFELFYGQTPFNNDASNAISSDAPGRSYVFRSNRQDSLYWSVRSFLKSPERSRVSRDVINTMLSLMLATFALVIIGVLLLYGQVLREVELARLKSRFVSSISHELKTPLSLIRLFSETLLIGRIVSEEEKQRFYSIINSESLRLTTLIDNILDFSRIEEGRKVYDIAPQDPRDLLEDTVESYRYQFEASGFELETSIRDDLPQILADPNGFKQAVLNLLDNALKYRGESKYVIVRLLRDGRYVKVEVEDRGIGIAAADLPKVFDMFYRSSESNVFSAKGSGLGLATVKHIMDSHKGKADVKSELGKGSTFSLFFPVIPGSGLD